MADAPNFAKLVPGFDFLQTLAKSAGSALPGIGQWVAPTLNPDEIDKRIEELRTVQFWLEQNARLLGTTIQALEVQRMTLSTLQTMNVQMGDLRESLKIRVPQDAPAASAPVPAPAPAPEAAKPAPAKKAGAKAAAAPQAAPGVIDPMQWWGALAKQFTELASTALRDGAGDVATAAAKPADAAAPASHKAAAPAKAAAKRTRKRSS